MKTAKIPVLGNIAPYGDVVLSIYKIHYTLRCLKYICSVSSPLRLHGLSLRSNHYAAKS